MTDREIIKESWLLGVSLLDIKSHHNNYRRIRLILIEVIIGYVNGWRPTVDHFFCIILVIYQNKHYSGKTKEPLILTLSGIFEGKLKKLK